MAQPKKRTSKSKTGTRRSHLINKLQKAVNRTSPVKVKRKKRFLLRKEAVAKDEKIIKPKASESASPTAEAKTAKPPAKKTAVKKTATKDPSKLKAKKKT